MFTESEPLPSSLFVSQVHPEIGSLGPLLTVSFSNPLQSFPGAEEVAKAVRKAIDDVNSSSAR